MHAPTARRIATLALTALLAATGVAACGSGHASAGSSAKAAASSLEANATVSNDLSTAEQQLLANLQANFRPTHPVQSVEAAIKATYPQGDTAKIEQYAVRTFTISVVHTKGPGSARDLWLQGVVNYAEQQGANTKVSGSPSPAVSISVTPAASSTSP